MYSQQVQIQEPRFKTRNAQDLAHYIDISHAMSSPVTVFMSKEDYENENTNIVHLFSYSIGKERVVTWAAYLRDQNRVVFDGGCKFNTYAFIHYQNDWKKRGFAPLTAQVKDKIGETMSMYMGSSGRHPLINTREDYKALLLFRSWYEDKIDDIEFTELMATLPRGELKYRYERAMSVRYEIDNILISFFEVINYREYNHERDDEINSYLDEIYQEVEHNISSYEKSLNINQVIGDYRQNKEAKKIAEAFERAISRSKYTREDVMDLLEDCPETDEECWGEYRDEKSPCAIYTYGRTSFHEGDERHPDLDDLR